jgi:lysozyme
MNISDKALKMIQHHEGIRQKPYRCPAKLWTVGVGHVLYPEQGKMKIEERDGFALKDADNRTFSMEEVDGILKADLARFERGVVQFCPVPLTQGQYDALISLLALMLVWEHYSAQPSVRRFFAGIWKARQKSC